MQACKKCGSIDVLREKQPQGNTRCLSCGHSKPSTEWDKPTVEMKSPGNTRHWVYELPDLITEPPLARAFVIGFFDFADVETTVVGAIKNAVKLATTNPDGSYNRHLDPDKFVDVMTKQLIGNPDNEDLGDLQAVARVVRTAYFEREMHKRKRARNKLDKLASSLSANGWKDDDDTTREGVCRPRYGAGFRDND